MAENADLHQCIICCEDYTKDGSRVPRLLSCSHTMCQQCLQAVIKAAGKQTIFHCPECRITHNITEKGVKEFPQNKYILSHLEARGKEDESVCHKHKRTLALFCRNGECRKALCALCYIESHKDHDVADFQEEAQTCKQALIDDVNRNIEILTKHKQMYIKLKEEIKLSTYETLSELETRQNCLIEQIRAEFKILQLIATTHREKEMRSLLKKVKTINERSAELSKIEQEVAQIENNTIIDTYTNQKQRIEAILTSTLSSEQEQISFRQYDETCYDNTTTDENVMNLIGQLRTINKVANLCADQQDGVQAAADEETVARGRHTHRSEQGQSVDCAAVQGRKQEAAAPAELVDIKLARRFQTEFAATNAIHSMDNGSIIISGEDCQGAKWLIRVAQLGTVLWSQQLKADLTGVTSTNVGNTSCLVLAHCDNSMIDFHDIEQNDTILYSLDVKDARVMCLTSSDHAIYFVDWSTRPYSLCIVDCTYFPPKLRDSSQSIVLGEEMIAGLCIVKRTHSDMVIVTMANKVCAFELQSGTPLWQFAERQESFTEDLYPWGVCSDNKGHIFVVDRSNDCVHILSQEGAFEDTIIEDLPYVQELTWDAQHSRLIVQHAEESDDSDICFVSTYQIQYRLKSNIGKVVEGWFGKGVGGWVGGGIDSLKALSNDIGKI